METTEQKLVQQPIADVTFAFIDIETTGLAPAQNGRVCEVALIRRKAGRRLDVFNQLINPDCLIPAEVTRIHGITNEMVEDKPFFSKIAPKLISLLSDCAVVCHNAAFDVPFLAYEFYNAGLRFPPACILDTLEYARKHGDFTSNKLGNISQELGFPKDGWHRALNDVVMTENIFLHFLKIFESEGARTLSDLDNLQRIKRRRNQ